jgi:hypothetical protein
MDKDRVVETIKEWIGVDNEIKTLQKQIREKRQDKKELSDMLVDIMKNNEIDEFDVNDGKIIYSKNKVKKSITKKHLLKAMSDIFKDNPEKAKEITSFILESREEKVNETIRRQVNK